MRKEFRVVDMGEKSRPEKHRFQVEKREGHGPHRLMMEWSPWKRVVAYGNPLNAEAEYLRLIQEYEAEKVVAADPLVLMYYTDKD